MLLFAWKAAVFPDWGSGLLCVAVGVIASHLMLPLKKFSWRSKALLSTGAAIVVLAMMVWSGPVRRPFELSRANLSGHWLVTQDLRDADLRYANLTGAKLRRADLSRANLSGAYLGDANLTDANLSGANLTAANLTGAYLRDANLSGANLIAAYLGDAKLNGADLSGANLFLATLHEADLTAANLSGASLAEANLRVAVNLTQEQLDKACGNEKTKLPVRLTLKPCN